MLEIIPIPAFKDNYIWLGVARDLNQCYVVDPGDAAPVLDQTKPMFFTVCESGRMGFKHPFCLFSNLNAF